MEPRLQVAVKVEVKKLKAGILTWEVKYPDWLAQIVAIKKSNDKVRVCIDFTNLNDASPDEIYPLPFIEKLVTLTRGHEMLSLMDGNVKYNQIFSPKEDQEKTSFITEGLYYFFIMPIAMNVI